METIELRIELTEEMLREVLWQALAPDALVLLGTLNDAIAKQRDMRGISFDGYQLSGISIIVENNVVYAELEYAPPS